MHAYYRLPRLFRPHPCHHARVTLVDSNSAIGLTDAPGLLPAHAQQRKRGLRTLTSPKTVRLALMPSLESQSDTAPRATRMATSNGKRLFCHEVLLGAGEQLFSLGLSLAEFDELRCPFVRGDRSAPHCREAAFDGRRSNGPRSPRGMWRRWSDNLPLGCRRGSCWRTCSGPRRRSRSCRG